MSGMIPRDRSRYLTDSLVLEKKLATCLIFLDSTDCREPFVYLTQSEAGFQGCAL